MLTADPFARRELFQRLKMIFQTSCLRSEGSANSIATSALTYAGKPVTGGRSFAGFNPFDEIIHVIDGAFTDLAVGRPLARHAIAFESAWRKPHESCCFILVSIGSIRELLGVRHSWSSIAMVRDRKNDACRE